MADTIRELALELLKDGMKESSICAAICKEIDANIASPQYIRRVLPDRFKEKEKTNLNAKPQEEKEKVVILVENGGKQKIETVKNEKVKIDKKDLPKYVPDHKRIQELNKEVIQYKTELEKANIIVNQKVPIFKNLYDHGFDPNAKFTYVWTGTLDKIKSVINAHKADNKEDQYFCYLQKGTPVIKKNV